MYDIDRYGDMIVDAVRMQAYELALRATVRPGCIVVDLGAGPCVFAMLACRLGAARVHAVEPDDIIQVGREIAAANGFADRIVFHQARAREVDLGERADVIVSDLRGVLPPFGTHLETVMDARMRWLASDGALVPQRDELYVALLEDPALHRPTLAPWREQPFGLDLQAGSHVAANKWRHVQVEAAALASEPVRFASLDYRTLSSPRVEATVVLVARRPAACTGLCLWFDAVLAQGAAFTSAPGAPPLIYGQAYFRWPEAVALREGDRVRVQLRAVPVGDEYVWTWSSSIERGGAALARFRQSTFFGAPMSADALRRISADHIPTLGEEGAIAQAVLEMMSRGLPLGDIATRLVEAHPRRFASWQDALARVGEMSLKYGAAK